MDLEVMTENKLDALQKWHEYVIAAKIYRKPEFVDLRNAYNQIKRGNKLIDIFKVIQRGGVHENFHPKLAIAKATTKKIFCSYYENGDVNFINEEGWSNRPRAPLKEDICLNACLHVFDKKLIVPSINGWRDNRLSLSAPVPIIPAKHMPKKINDDHYILWEVDHWKPEPPTDPYLLRRITKTLFVVIAGWDLTPIEKSVMAGRML